MFVGRVSKSVHHNVCVHVLICSSQMWTRTEIVLKQYVEKRWQFYQFSKIGWTKFTMTKHVKKNIFHYEDFTTLFSWYFSMSHLFWSIRSSDRRSRLVFHDVFCQVNFATFPAWVRPWTCQTSRQVSLEYVTVGSGNHRQSGWWSGTFLIFPSTLW